jgi:uncharacterized membrane protein
MFAVVWHYWIGVAVFIMAVLAMVALFFGYLKKTQAPQYGRDD